MTLPRVSAAAVRAGAALCRADTKDELEAFWLSSGCDAFRGAARTYLLGIYQQQVSRLNSNEQVLRWARAS